MSMLVALFLCGAGAPTSGLAADDAGGRPAAPKVVAPVVQETTERYPVAGNCEKDLSEQLARKATCRPDGRKYDSQVKWKVGWAFDHERAAGACSPEGFRLTVNMTTSLPDWVDRATAPEPLMFKWDVYLQSLERHEQGHRAIVLRAAEELSRAIAALPPASSCKELDRRVNQVCRTRLARLAEEQDGYDAETEHGRVQGALFP